MKLVAESVRVITADDPIAKLKRIERAGRTCYRSEDKVTPDSYKQFISRMIEKGHDSVLEHESISVLVTCDRAVANEIVRHRIGSYCQESTRYCRYDQGDLAFISPFKSGTDEFETWKSAMREAEACYCRLLDYGASPELARSVLPLSLSTSLYITFNIRQWRHFLSVRTSVAAHPQIRVLSDEILGQLRDYIPLVFDDIS